MSHRIRTPIDQQTQDSAAERRLHVASELCQTSWKAGDGPQAIRGTAVEPGTPGWRLEQPVETPQPDPTHGGEHDLAKLDAEIKEQ